MLESAAFLILANHLRDIYNQLNSTIVEARSHRPTWKVTIIKVPEKDSITGMVFEREEKIVDKLASLIAMARTLENAAGGGIDISNQSI